MKCKYQICTNCVMDTSDPNISFDQNGVCDHCNNFRKNILPTWNPNAERLEELEKLSKKIRWEGKGREYDCILGLSGGADSSYLAYVAKEIMHLRPLVYVVDTGWNLNVAVENIEKIVKGLGVDMYTEVINWKEMRDIQLATFKAQIPGQDIVQDHAIFTSMYKYAVKHRIKYVLTGSNNATEIIKSPRDILGMDDKVLYKYIHKKFGKIPIKTFPKVGMVTYKIVYRLVYGMKRIYPLDYINYNKEEAEKLLHEKYGWMKYKNKHYENVFTRFFEGYYLPHKFGWDTRRAVCSSQILAGTLSRDEALKILEESPYEEKQMRKDLAYIAKKLNISTEEFEEIIEQENKSFYDYPNSYWLIKLGIRVYKMLGIDKRNIR